MELTKEEEKIYKEMKEVMAPYLVKLKRKISNMTLCKVNEGVPTKAEKIKEFLEETTEQTRNKKDKISIKDLSDRYDEWQRKKGGGYDTLICSVRDFGKIFGYMNNDVTNGTKYEKCKADIQGKTAVVVMKLKYKRREFNSVNEFLNEYTIKTEDKNDRITMKKLIYIYNTYTENQRITNDIFKEKANLGDYRAKTCYEKIVKGPGRSVEPCIMCVKATEKLEKLLEEHKAIF